METGEHDPDKSEQQDEDGGMVEKAKQAAKSGLEPLADDSQHSDAPGASGTEEAETPRAAREGRD